MMLRGQIISALALALVVSGCNHHKPMKLTATPATSVKSNVMEPFHFHKLIEVSPGQDYDILSWGRGGNSGGSLLILHSDSAAKKYTTTTGDLDGNITDVYNSDMDTDGNPELLIECKGRDTINYSTIYAFEFIDSKVQKLDFPKLTSSQKKGYRGADNFYMKDGNLIREFPLYDKNDASAKPTGQKRILRYSLHNNSLTVKDLSADTAKTTGTATVIKPEKPKAVKKSEVHKSKKKKSSSSSHKRKKRHRG